VFASFRFVPVPSFLRGPVVKTLRILILLGLLTGSLVGGEPAGAAVVIVENQTAEKVEFTIRRPDGRESQHALLPGELTPIAVTSPVKIVFDSDGRLRRYALQINNIYCFVRRDERLDLSTLAFPAPEGATYKQAMGSTDGGSRPSPGAVDSVYTVSVKILADDEEPRVRALWEKELRRRLAAASEIFERYCRVRFQVAAVDTWVADKGIHDFNQSAAEFERNVSPAPARLAIGFTGRYNWAAGENHMGASRGPLRSHILIRGQLVRVSEPEKLEVLVHELGHFLGAVHSPDGTSVMRPKLGDRQSCARSFRIGFDAPNTLAMYLLGEELRRRPIFRLSELPPESKASLQRVYAWAAKALPDDPAAPKYLELLDAP